MVSWIVWLIIAAVLGVAEILTTTLAFGLIAVAALVAAAVGAFHLDLAAQLAAFVVAAGPGWALSARSRSGTSSNRRRCAGTAALVGRSAIVLEEVNEHSGRVPSRARTGPLVPTWTIARDPGRHQARRHADQGRHRTCLSPGVAMILAEIIVAAVVAIFVVITVVRSVRIVPQARARNVERLGRYRKTLEPGMNFVIPMIDRVKPIIDLREQVVSFNGGRSSPRTTWSCASTGAVLPGDRPRAANYESSTSRPSSRSPRRCCAA